MVTLSTEVGATPRSQFAPLFQSLSSALPSQTSWAEASVQAAARTSAAAPHKRMGLQELRIARCMSTP